MKMITTKDLTALIEHLCGPEALLRDITTTEKPAMLTLTLSSDLDKKLNEVIKEDKTSKDEVFRKALLLFIEARKGIRDGMELQLKDPEDKGTHINIIGL